MSDKRNVKFEIVDHRHVPQKFAPYQELALIGHWRLGAWLCGAMAAIIAIGVATISDDDIKPVMPANKVYASEMNPALSSEINELKGQFVGLVSGSIENKLKTLEDNIRTGSVANSLGTIEDLKKDVRVLRSYSKPIIATPNTVVSNTELLQEVSHLRNLIYLTISSCGLMIAAVAGVWIKNRRRLPYKQPVIVPRYLGKD